MRHYHSLVFVVFFLLSCTFVAQAIPGQLSGVVTSCDGSAANGATVTLLGTNIAPVVTNATGAYLFNVEQGIYHARVHQAACGSLTQNTINVGASTIQNLTLPTDPVTAGSLPDAGGYSAIESGDVNGPTFSWLEIAPDGGGPGTVIPIGQDQSVFVTLPFTFRFYGVNYTGCYISSNGLVTFSAPYIEDQNVALPVAAMGPAIVMLWDHFDPALNGQLVRYFSVANHAFIIEWFEFTRDDTDQETFQLWLYDSGTNPGPTGDSQIRMQYLDKDPNETNYTTGIQNGSIFTQYYEHNNPDFTSQGLVENNAITFNGVGGIYLSTITGVITDCIGGPTIGATVSIPGTSYTTTTNATGDYTLSLASGTYSLLARHYPCSDGTASDIALFPSQTAVTNVTLSPSGILQGNITSCDGGGASGATVTVSGGPYTPPAQISDASGFYQFSALPAGTYTINITYASCFPQAPLTNNIVTAGGTTTRDVTLPPLGTIQGTVTSCLGGPAVGATVTITSGPTRPPATTTDGAGLYSFNHLVAGTYALSLTFPSCQTTTSTGIVVSSGVVTRNVTLTSLGTMQGTITNCLGGVASGAIVTITSGPTLPPADTTDAVGFYQIPFLLPGTYAISVSFAGCVNTASTGIVIGSTVVTRNVTLIAPGGIQGTINSCLGGVAAGAIVTVTSGPTIPPPDTTDAAGFYLFSPLTFGTYGISISYPGCVTTTSTAIVVNNGTATRNVTLLNLGTIQGTVTSCFGGPAVGATVSITSGTTIPPAQTTDSLGHYRFDGLVAGTYALLVSFPPCFDVTSAGIVISIGSNVLRDFTLITFGALQGQVTGCDGNPAASATLLLSGGPSTPPPALADSLGNYIFPSLFAGTYAVSISYPGCAAFSLAGIAIVSAQSTTQNITLILPGAMQGIITSCLGGPAIGATVTILGPSSPTPVTTDALGFYQFTNLIPGTYNLTAQQIGCAPGFVNNNTIVSGSTLMVDVTLVTNPAFQCSPSDLYGYYACENVDATGPEFAWKFVAPHHGGSGTAITGFTDNSFVGPRALPFPVKLYGTTYTQFFVGSNGFLSFGTGSTNGTNMCFPQPAMPAGFYAYWDNLFPTLAVQQIASLYDATDHTFTVEFYQADQAAPRGSLQTFEYVIRDQQYYPTITGDNEVIFQYDSLSILNSCTIGIMANGTLFQQYECNGVNAASSAGVANGRAIRWSTNPPCTGAAQISVLPPSFSSSALTGSMKLDSVQICNLGNCPLTYSVDFSQTSPTSIGTSDDRRDALDNGAGPDAGGYRWKDINEPGGPTFSWAEIRNIGTNLGLSSNDTAATIALPWPFTFYGVSYTSIYVNSNGYLNFGAAVSVGNNEPMPSVIAPNAMIAPMWDDLNPAVAGRIWAYHDVSRDRFIIEWDSVAHAFGIGNFTFEAILYPYGDIVFQYNQLIGDLGQASAGIENETGLIGLPVIFNGPYLFQGLAIRYYSVAPWGSFPSVFNGIIPPGSCNYVRVNFDATRLAPGSYAGQFSVFNNTPGQSPFGIPINLSVFELNPADSVTIGWNRTTRQFTLRWRSAPTVPEYRIYSATEGTGPYTTFVGTTTTNSFVIPIDSAERKLFFRVVASDGTP